MTKRRQLQQRISVRLPFDAAPARFMPSSSAALNAPHFGHRTCHPDSITGTLRHGVRHDRSRARARTSMGMVADVTADIVVREAEEVERF